MYCFKCFLKIEEEGKCLIKNDRLEWYHYSCYPEQDQLTDTERAIAKSVAIIVKILGEKYIGDESKK